MFRKVLVVSVLAVLFLGYAGSQAYSQSYSQPYTTSVQQDQGRAPIVLNAYAARVIRPGDTWMIFLRAQDPEGEMKSIAAVLWQAGVGYYPTEVTMLKGEEAREFSGYIYLQTPADLTLSWDELEMSLIIRDNQNRSQLVRLPLTFDMSARQVIPEKWQEAANHRITALMFDVESSQHYNRGGNGGSFN